MPKSPSGYSGTPLGRKLGYKEGFTVRIINEPEHYWSLFADLPVILNMGPAVKGPFDLIHYFETASGKLKTHLPKLKTSIQPNGMIWVSWPKKSSKRPSDITEDLIRNFALSIGLVDIKVCAVDEVWSGLKLVIRKAERGRQKA